MKVYLKFKDGSVRRAHFKIRGGFEYYHVKVSSEGVSTTTTLTEDEYYTIKSGGMVLVDGVYVVMRKFANLEDLTSS